MRPLAAGGLFATAGGAGVGMAVVRALRRRRGSGLLTPAPDLSGAPYRLDARPRSARVTGNARIAPPPWEPTPLTALAAWEPAVPRTTAGRAAAYLWAAPVTAVGLLVGAAAGVRPSVRAGVLLFPHARGLTGPVLRRAGYAAGTFGHVVVSTVNPGEVLFGHELVHVRQAERLGALLAPVYFGLLAVYGYARHPLERAARNAGRRIAGAPV